VERRGTLHPAPPARGGPRRRRAGADGAPGSHAEAGGPARAHTASGGGPQAGARPPPPPPGRQRAAATATTDSRDPTHARARAPERGATAGGGRRPSPRQHTTPPPDWRAAADTDGRPQRAWEAPAHRGRGTGSAARRGEATRRLSGEELGGARNRKSGGGGERTAGSREEAQGALSKAPPDQRSDTEGHTGSHHPRPPAQGRSRGTQGRRPGPHGGPWQPRGARAPKHHQHHRSHARPPETLSRTHNDATPATQLEAGPARALLSSSPGDREHFAWGRPPPGKPVATARGGDDTQTSGEAGFGPERADRGHRRAFRQSGRGNGSGSASAAPGRRKHSGRGPGARGGRTGSGKGAPTKTQAGPPGKRARDPTATSTRAVPRRPGRQPASAPLASLPTNRAPHRCGPDPREPPPRGPVLNLRPSGPSRKVATLEKRPQARAARPVPGTPPPSGDSGRERAGRQPLARHGEAGRAGAPPEPLGRQHREGAAARALARTRTREPHAPDAGQARRDPPPTRRGEAQAAVGKERRSAPPRGRQNQTPSQRGRALPNTQR